MFLKPFERYDRELLAFARKNDLVLPGIDTQKGQALALLSHPSIRGRVYLTRFDTDEFFENIGMYTSDSIQAFNKPFGLKRIKKKRGTYCLEYPFKLDMNDIEKRKDMNVTGNRDCLINSIKQWWMDNLVNIPNRQWHIGHLDPTISDSTENNLAYQPPIQSKYRDRFKWCPLFHRMWPTTKELIPKFDRYYTENEQMEIYEHLKKKFDQ